MRLRIWGKVRDLKREGVLHIRRGVGRDIEYSRVILSKKKP